MSLPNAMMAADRSAFSAAKKPSSGPPPSTLTPQPGPASYCRTHQGSMSASSPRKATPVNTSAAAWSASSAPASTRVAAGAAAR